MADIVNLRRARKDRAREAARKAGDANAAKHGRGKGARARQDAEEAARVRQLDGHLRERPAQQDGESGEKDEA